MTRLADLPGFLKRFGKNQKGNVAILFALSAIPVFLAAGASIDYARYYAGETKLQAALDSAALSAAAAHNLTNAQRITAANAALKENLKQGELAEVTSAFTIKDETVYATAEMKLPTSFMAVGGISEMLLSAVTEIAIPDDKNAEIALVLDYSHSMTEKISGGVKYIAMKNAAKRLIDDLQQANPSKVKFGLVPFSNNVYVTLPKAYVLGQTGSGNWTGCTLDRPYPANLTDATPTTNNNTKWGQPESPGGAVPNCSGYTSNKLFVKPLTDDFNGLKSQIDSMTPYSNTHIALGVEFGFHLLSDNAPFTNGVSYSDKKTEKIMIVLTDGAQTEGAFGSGGGRSANQGKSNLEVLCENAKAKGITMMTIAYDLNDTDTRKRLRNCTTDPIKHFFVADDTAAVASAFDNIKNVITAQVFISK